MTWQSVWMTRACCWSTTRRRVTSRPSCHCDIDRSMLYVSVTEEGDDLTECLNDESLLLINHQATGDIPTIMSLWYWPLYCMFQSQKKGMTWQSVWMTRACCWSTTRRRVTSRPSCHCDIDRSIVCFSHRRRGWPDRVSEWREPAADQPPGDGWHPDHHVAVILTALCYMFQSQKKGMTWRSVWMTRACCWSTTRRRVTSRPSCRWRPARASPSTGTPCGSWTYSLNGPTSGWSHRSTGISSFYRWGVC